MLCLNMQMRYNLIITLGDFRRNIREQIDKVRKINTYICLPDVFLSLLLIRICYGSIISPKIKKLNNAK